MEVNYSLFEIWAWPKLLFNNVGNNDKYGSKCSVAFNWVFVWVLGRSLLLYHLMDSRRFADKWQQPRLILIIRNFKGSISIWICCDHLAIVIFQITNFCSIIHSFLSLLFQRKKRNFTRQKIQVCKFASLKLWRWNFETWCFAQIIIIKLFFNQ